MMPRHLGLGSKRSGVQGKDKKGLEELKLSSCRQGPDRSTSDSVRTDMEASVLNPMTPTTTRSSKLSKPKLQTL